MDCVFFIQCSTIDWWCKRAIVNIVSPQYPLLLFSYLQHQFHDATWKNFQAIDLDDGCHKAITAQLTLSFLGTQFIYWLKNFNGLDAKKRAYWTAFLENYKGPHCLLVYSDKKIPVTGGDHVVHVEVPEWLDLVLAEQILKSLCPGSLTQTSILLRSLFKGRKKISLDTLFLCVRYMEVAELDLEQLLTQWIDLILLPESSLFDLSKNLFAGNVKSFFMLWEVQGKNYPSIFWVSYWSDIMWRAYHFIRLSESGQSDQAKKIGSRLPFTFIQGGWRQVQCTTLKSALDYLYALDGYAKSSSTNDAYLELFYLKFFTSRW